MVTLGCFGVILMIYHYENGFAKIMIMDVTLLIIVTIISVAYLFFSMKDGVPDSISATYYALGDKGWLCPLVMFLLGTCLLPVWMDASEEGHKYLVFLSCASLWFVAAAPCFRLELEGKVHYSAAVVCCLCAVTWQILEELWDITLWFVWIGGMLSLVWRKQWCWWTEWAVTGSLVANLWRVI